MAFDVDGKTFYVQSGVRLFLVSDADGSMHLEKISDRPLHQDMLHSGVSPFTKDSTFFHFF